MVSKKVKRIGAIVGILILILISLGTYLFFQLPKPLGKPVVLQQELFKKPEKDFPFTGKFLYKSAAELHKMLANHEATSVEIVTDFINNIKNNNYKYCALIYLREQEALDEAKKADEAIAAGDTSRPLLGVPVTIKEHYWVKGSPCTMNAKMYGFTAYEDAPVVEAIKKSGAIILGTTNDPFMLSDYQTQGEVYPTASNPYDTTRTPGGSTGGGAAALAAGFTTMELGSDMGGSIRLPSAFCGLYGLKTTFGTINLTQGGRPDTVNHPTRFALATGGPLARTPEDLELYWQTIRDAKPDEKLQQKVDWKPASEKTLSQYHFAYIDEWNREMSGGKIKVSNDVKEKLNMLIDSLKGSGAAVEKTAPSNYDAMMSNFMGSFSAMIGEGQPWILRKLIAMQFSAWSDGSPVFNEFFESMNHPTDERWKQVSDKRTALTSEWQEYFKKYDFFVVPISYGEAFKKCATGSKINDDGNEVSYGFYVPYTGIFNVTGHPSIAIPLGLNKKGMPIGLQIVGQLYSEPELLHLAKLLKPITPGFTKPKS